MLKFLIKLAIKGYQKFISPHKGYGCAHRVQGGAKTGCSGYALRVLNKHSLIKSMLIMRRRFDRCAWYAQKARAQVQQKAESLRINQYQVAHSQRGECDCDCGDVDCPSFVCISDHPSQSRSFYGCFLDSLDFGWSHCIDCSRPNSNSSSGLAATREEIRRKNRQEQATQSNKTKEEADISEEN